MTEIAQAPLSAEAIANARRARVRKVLRLTLSYTVMSVALVVTLFPIVFMLVSSFKPNRIIFEDLRSLNAFVPTTFTLVNYQEVFIRTNFPRFMFNSVFISTMTVLLSLFINSLAAFSLARLNWKGRGVILGILIALLIIPFETIAIPLLFVVNGLPWPVISQTTGGMQVTMQTSWLNTLHVQIFPFVADAFTIFLFYQFFLDIPKELDESALVDGASPFRIYWNIILPLSRPAFATVAILQFLFRWNDYLWPTIAVPGENARPLTVGIATFYTQTPDWGQIMAYASMITVPVLIVFLLFQKWFIQSIATSGLKG